MVVFRGFIKKETAKHVDDYSHAGMEAVCNGIVKAEYGPSTKMIGTTLTKPFGPETFRTVKDLIPLMVSVIDTM